MTNRNLFSCDRDNISSCLYRLKKRNCLQQTVTMFTECEHLYVNLFYRERSTCLTLTDLDMILFFTAAY